MAPVKCACRYTKLRCTTSSRAASWQCVVGGLSALAAKQPPAPKAAAAAQKPAPKKRPTGTAVFSCPLAVHGQLPSHLERVKAQRQPLGLSLKTDHGCGAILQCCHTLSTHRQTLSRHSPDTLHMLSPRPPHTLHTLCTYSLHTLQKLFKYSPHTLLALLNWLIWLTWLT